MGSCASTMLRRRRKDEMEGLSPIVEPSMPREDRAPDGTEPPVSAVGEVKDRSDGKGKEEEDGIGGDEEEEDGIGGDEEEEDGIGGDEDEELDKILEELKKSETGKKEWHKDEVKRRSLSILFEENDKSEMPKGKHVDVETSEAAKLETSMKIDNEEPPIEEKKSSSESKEVEVEMAESNQSASGTEVTDKSGGSGESQMKVMDAKISDESDQKEQSPIHVKEPVTEAKIIPEEGTVEPEEPTSLNVVEELKEGMENLKDGLISLIFGHDATVTQPTSDSTLPTETVVTEEKEKEVVKDVKIEEISKEVESSNPAEVPSKN